MKVNAKDTKFFEAEIPKYLQCLLVNGDLELIQIPNTAIYKCLLGHLSLFLLDSSHWSKEHRSPVGLVFYLPSYMHVFNAWSISDATSCLSVVN